MSDLRLAIRQLWKSPGYTTLAVVTLAFGIGANSAVFSVIHGIWLKPLPYPEPDRLVALWERSPERGVDRDLVSGPDYLDWREQNTVFSSLAVTPAWSGAMSFNLVQPHGTTRVQGGYVSSSFFTTFGTGPLLGRTLRPEEDRHEGPQSVVLSYGLWQRQFAGRPDILGQPLTVDSYGRRDYTIVGVMPPGFGSPGESELWLPLGWTVGLDERRSAHWHQVVGRLKPGVSLEQARQQMNGIQARLRRAHPGDRIGSEVAVVPFLHEALGVNLRTALILLWGVVAAVLLIACANVANLTLTRAITRRQEIAVRLALGAGRRRVMRPLLLESLVLSVAGCVLGILQAFVWLRLFIAFSPPDIPRLSEASLDGTALVFTVLLSLATGLLSGFIPAWQASRTSLNETLKAHGRSASDGAATGRTRNALVIGQVALSLVLLVAAGLMLQSFAHMLRAERGFQPDHLITAQLDFSVSGFTTWVEPTDTRPQVPLKEFLDHLRSRPGVLAVGAASTMIRHAGPPPNQTFSVWQRPALDPKHAPTAEFMGISPGWFQALGGQIRRGRDFTEADSLRARGVALVSEAFVRRYFPNEDPMGHYLALDAGHPRLEETDRFGIPLWSEIIGVVSDIKSLDPQPEAIPTVYRPYWQWPMQSPAVAVRFRGDPATIAAAIRDDARLILPKLPAPRVRTMADLLSQGVTQPRLQTGLFTVFGAVALFLAALGLYGVLACSVAQRGREFGIRMALGARRGDMAALVLRRGMLLALAGVAAGIPAALAVSRAMSALLYGIQPTDTGTLTGVSALLMGVACLASWLPARMATRVEPVTVLRAD